MNNKHRTQKIGLWTCTCLVVGNMIASGIFMLPGALAKYGSISLFGWIGSAFGAVTLALLFSKLSKKLPGATGGPYAYTHAGLGEFASFLVAWAYWIANCITGAAITTTLLSYLSVFLPILKTDNLVAVATGLAVIWVLAFVNMQGVKSAGKVQLITTVLKVMPLLAVSLFGLYYVEPANFEPLNNTSDSDISVITTTATLTLFAFVGLESATVPSANVENPRETIPRATMIGIIITIALYIAGSVVVMGMIPNAQLAVSTAPFADAAAMLWGNTGRYTIAVGAIISTFGALNGWILLQGQIPYAAAKDGIFPPVFSKLNKRGVPVIGIALSAIVISTLMTMNFTKGLTNAFTFFVLLSTMIVLVPYLFSSISLAILDAKEKSKQKAPLVVAFAAFFFAMWAVIGSGAEAVYWGFIGLLAGLPLYIIIRRSSS